ncbi:putative hydroxymethylglutaryl-CoA lyase [Rhodococcus erythropolis]|uniref:Putative hydroxymethylglutaryl-CoA lyase n=1 Tax=Rhodococcus erythropolis TaxID=1833 RepID=A0A6G9CL43_RHOER|nr:MULTISPECIES: hydroxymethylglutaryl-CoA lyase [Rhodococcus]MCJ0899250.1 hydroxymethylglutaryl-CoA lyase [Rhodococcus sp. ARC_M13]QIP37727.1 putative hydroxymethylglutaryl-CoA lyase [Rhodococcus erythropolis]UKO87063.1 hydroxymethylglutaryl-CoA lyase [Rhodococcus erythropolis]
MSVPEAGVPAVSIREVGPRDGLQIEDPVSLAEKLRLVEALAATGVSRIEATSFVSPRAVPALADAELLAAELYQWPGIEFSALVAGIGGAKRAVAAGMKTVEYVVSASNSHSEANTRSTTEQATERIGEVVRIVHEAGGRVEVIVATAWDCPFDGPTDPDRVLRIAEQAKEFGADQFSIADTIGTATPGRVGRLIDAVGERVGDFGLGVHFHNTRGAGLASALAAVQHGVRNLDASTGGLGGCPFAPGASGNIATEELVYMLEDMGIATGIDLDASIRAAAVAEEIVGHTVPSNLLRAGDRKR